MSDRKIVYSNEKEPRRSAKDALPPLRKEADPVLAILISDIHLSMLPPVARSVEPDWFDAMKRPLSEIVDLSIKYDCPVVCAGDIFHKWNSPAELINFALEHLPRLYAVPGQHDLSHHRYETIKKTSYWTLVEAGKIINLPHNEPVDLKNGLVLWGFPWGSELFPKKPTLEDKIHLAVVHKYVWTNGHGYVGASKDNLSKNLKELLHGYDFLHFGDNHSGFLKHKLFNAGALLRRRSDERDYRPHVGLLRRSGIVLHYLDTSDDCIMDMALEIRGDGVTGRGEEFLQKLNQLADKVVDFEETLKRVIDEEQTRREVCDLIWEAVTGTGRE
jgi:hypothetical protein